jgi:nicotinamidase-related amidase
VIEHASNDSKGYSSITLSAATTALILIDLQKGIVTRQFAPYSGEAVLAKGKELAWRFRAAKAPVVLVNVAFAPDFSDALKAPVDRPLGAAPSGGFSEDWSELADGRAAKADEIEF